MNWLVLVNAQKKSILPSFQNRSWERVCYNKKGPEKVEQTYREHGLGHALKNKVLDTMIFDRKISLQNKKSLVGLLGLGVYF